MAKTVIVVAKHKKDKAFDFFYRNGNVLTELKNLMNERYYAKIQIENFNIEEGSQASFIWNELIQEEAIDFL